LPETERSEIGRLLLQLDETLFFSQLELCSLTTPLEIDHV